MKLKRFVVFLLFSLAFLSVINADVTTRTNKKKIVIHLNAAKYAAGTQLDSMYLSTNLNMAPGKTFANIASITIDVGYLQTDGSINVVNCFIYPNTGMRRLYFSRNVNGDCFYSYASSDGSLNPNAYKYSVKSNGVVISLPFMNCFLNHSIDYVFFRILYNDNTTILEMETIGSYIETLIVEP